MKDIEQFMNEIAEYVNQYIVGRDGSHIAKCEASGIETNRGHGIFMHLVIPDAPAGTPPAMGPCFYIEELMEAFPDGTAAGIAEAVSMRTENLYPEFRDVMRRQMDMSKKKLEDIPKEDLILTAIPLGLAPAQNKGVFIDRERPDLGLLLTIKAANGRNSENPNQTYFMPIVKKNGRPPKEEDWENAMENSRKAAELNVDIFTLPIKDGNKSGPIVIGGEITDQNAFYDYFYLIEAGAWSEVMKRAEAERIFIVPCGSCRTKFIVDNEKVRNNKHASALRSAFIEESVKEMGGVPQVFTIDKDEMKIKKMEGGI